MRGTNGPRVPTSSRTPSGGGRISRSRGTSCEIASARGSGLRRGRARYHPQPVATEDLYHDLYEQFVGLQRGASGSSRYADRRIRELKKHYESKLGWARHEADQIVEMNEWLVEQLQLQADRMRDLAIPDVPSTDWLTGRTPVPMVADDGGTMLTLMA